MVKLRNLIRWLLLQPYYLLLTKLYKMDISSTARISLGAKLDKTYPKGIHIDDESYVASGALVFSHDYARSLHTDTHIGRQCFIGANAIVMPGLTIGDSVKEDFENPQTAGIGNTVIIDRTTTIEKEECNGYLKVNSLEAII